MCRVVPEPLPPLDPAPHDATTRGGVRLDKAAAVLGDRAAADRTARVFPSAASG